MLAVSLRCSFWHFMKFMTLLAFFLTAFPRKWTQLTVNNLRQGHAGHTKRACYLLARIVSGDKNGSPVQILLALCWVIYFSITCGERAQPWSGSWRSERQIPETLRLCQKLKVAAARQIVYLQKRAPALRAYDNPKSKAPSAHFMQRPLPPPPARPVCLLGRKLATKRERSRINYQAAGI